MRVLLVVDDPLARAGLATLLVDAAELTVEALEIVGQFASADDDLETALARSRPDVALWDLGWEPAENLDRLSDFAEIGPPVVALLPTLDQARVVWQTGVRGLLDRDAGGAQIVAALATVIHDLVVIDPEMAAALPLNRAAQAQDEVLETLTPREFDVLQLLAEGASNKEIARRLSISDHTVKYHVNAILGKLDAQSRTEAVVRATRAGLILL